MFSKGKHALRLLAVVFATLLCGLIAGAESSSASALRYYQTKFYRLYTDVDPELARDLSRRLDGMFDEYSRRLNAFGSEEDRKDVYVFSTRDAYAQFIEERLPNSGGVFIPSRGVLAAYEEGQGRDSLKRTLQHEAFHQFAYSTIGPKMPVWLNEGIAQLFEEGIWTGDRFVLEQVPPRRLRQLQADVREGRLTAFESFVKRDGREWMRVMRDRERGSTQYNQAWAMVHFLVYAVGPDGQPLYRQRLFDMMKMIQAGTSAENAFAATFGNNFAGFEKRFSEYLRTLRPSREAAYVEQIEVLADMLVQLDKQSIGFDEIDAFKNHLIEGGYRLHYTRGNMTWSSNDDVRVYFNDLDGRPLSSTQINFVRRQAAPLPDIVLRPPGPLEYRARFHRNADGSLEREITVSTR